MGLSSKKTKTTPIVSDWMKPKLDDFSGRVSDFVGSDPHQYVAPASQLQTRAFAGADNLGGWRPYATQALDMAGDAATRGPASAQAYLSGARSIFDDGGIQRYLDPAVQSNIDPALTSYDRDVGRRGAAMQATAARNGAFGGSRYGIAQGEFASDSALGRANLEAQMRQQAYAQALEAAQRETDRAQQADIFNAGQQTNVSQGNAALLEQAQQRYLQSIGLLGDLGNNYSANDRADLGQMAELGAQQRGIETDYRNALPTQLQLAGNLYGAIPPPAYIGSKSKGSGLGYIWDYIANNAAAAAKIAGMGGG